MFHWQLSFKKGLYSFYFVCKRKDNEKRKQMNKQREKK